MALNVLVVDDSRVVRKMIIKTLHLARLPIGEVFEAGDGQAALEQMEQHWIDLVLADLNMPVMNGEEMIDRMQANPATRDTPTVVVSTEGSETRIERLTHKGVRFVHKPFTPETIRDTIVEITGLEIDP